MTSLGEAYGGAGTDRRRLYLGVGLFLVGSLALVAAIAVTTTEVLTGAGYTVGEAREIGGIVGGVGAPVALLGVFTVMPAARRTRAAAVVGASVAGLGVALFSHAYPCRWVNATCGGPATADLTLPTVGVYFLGVMTTLWCLFVGVANLKTRNDPGGTAKLDVVRKNETRVVEVPESSSGFGGIGLFGADPDGDVATQTASDGGADDGAVVTSPAGTGAGTPSGTDGTGNGTPGAGGAFGGGAGGSAGGSSSRTPSSQRSSTAQGSATSRTASSSANRSGSANGSRSGSANRSASTAAGPGATGATNGRDGSTDRPAGDAYCGSCRHFEYVRTDEGMQPYCGHHEELMEDMDACETWEPRGDGRLLVD